MEDKKKMSLPLKIIIIGCIIGVVVAGIGGLRYLSAVKTNEKRKEEATKEVEKRVDQANKRLKEIEEEYNSLKEELEKKEQECDKIRSDMNGDDWVIKSGICSREKQELQSKIWNLESENTLLKNGDYNVYYQTVSPWTYYWFFIIGGAIALLAILGAFIIYLVKGEKKA